MTIIEGSKVAIISQVATDSPAMSVENESLNGLYILFGAFFLGIIGFILLRKRKAIN